MMGGSVRQGGVERLGSEGGREEGRLGMRGTGGVWEGRREVGPARVRRGRELARCCVTAFEAYDVASVSLWIAVYEQQCFTPQPFLRKCSALHAPTQ